MKYDIDQLLNNIKIYANSAIKMNDNFILKNAEPSTPSRIRRPKSPGAVLKPAPAPKPVAPAVEPVAVPEAVRQKLLYDPAEASAAPKPSQKGMRRYYEVDGKKYIQDPSKPEVILEEIKGGGAYDPVGKNPPKGIFAGEGQELVYYPQDQSWILFEEKPLYQESKPSPEKPKATAPIEPLEVSPPPKGGKVKPMGIQEQMQQVQTEQYYGEKPPKIMDTFLEKSYLTGYTEPKQDPILNEEITVKDLKTNSNIKMSIGQFLKDYIFDIKKAPIKGPAIGYTDELRFNVEVDTEKLGKMAPVDAKGKIAIDPKIIEIAKKEFKENFINKRKFIQERKDSAIAAQGGKLYNLEWYSNLAKKYKPGSAILRGIVHIALIVKFLKWAFGTEVSPTNEATKEAVAGASSMTQSTANINKINNDIKNLKINILKLQGSIKTKNQPAFKNLVTLCDNNIITPEAYGLPELFKLDESSLQTNLPKIKKLHSFIVTNYGPNIDKLFTEVNYIINIFKSDYENNDAKKIAADIIIQITSINKEVTDNINFARTINL